MPGNTDTLPGEVPESATQYQVPMRDRVLLATDVYLPADCGGAVPAILVRLPYDKNSRYVFMKEVAERVTADGYVLVVQDVRGKFRSQGVAIGPLSEANDGFDTLEWIVRQSWSDGAVGMFGDSYYGFTQWAAVSSAHPALRAIVPRVTSARLPLFESSRSGVVGEVEWLNFIKYIAECWSGRYLPEVQFNWELTPLTAVFEDMFERTGLRAPWYDLMVPRVQPVPVFSNGHPFDQKPIPVMHTVGWYDNVAKWSFRDYMELSSRPDWAPLQYLWADSVDHENYHLSLAPIAPEDDHNVDAAALQRMLDLYIEPALKFFDVFLKRSEPVESLPRVQWHLGHDTYRTSEIWPPPEAQTKRLYIGDLESAGSTTGGVLSSSPPVVRQHAPWKYDPSSLIPSAVDNSFAFLFDYPDESHIDELAGVIHFDSEATDGDIDFAGPVNLWLSVVSSAPTTDVYARLLDVSPGGGTRMIVRGEAVLHQPNADELVMIELGHVGYRLQRGHRLRLRLTNSDYPEYPPNSGSSEDRWTAQERRSSVQELTTGSTAPAHLEFHVLE
ncbi:CocE/NonD family hydrolase [Arthrobacter sp. S2(2024)]|uniref:CocE/NonD family hydrolase n=1 Tax=Arthrobacter sp. S2(2024) TaxID=3111911 RepID=UPI002FC722CC